MHLQSGSRGIVDVFELELHDNFLLGVHSEHRGHFIGNLHSGGFGSDGLVAVGDPDLNVFDAHFRDDAQLDSSAGVADQWNNSRGGAWRCKVRMGR